MQGLSSGGKEGGSTVRGRPDFGFCDIISSKGLSVNRVMLLSFLLFLGRPIVGVIIIGIVVIGGRILF